MLTHKLERCLIVKPLYNECSNFYDDLDIIELTSVTLLVVALPTSADHLV